MRVSIQFVKHNLAL